MNTKVASYSTWIIDCSIDSVCKLADVLELFFSENGGVKAVAAVAADQLVLQLEGDTGNGDEVSEVRIDGNIQSYKSSST
ncbi:Os11g0149400 [Oryza sativa Japonica Group]|uniref:Os11g0149400 protein n=1 Tax=Oryza sativa subsp. japonica TaxID=39947 RepID=A0A0P0XZ69_ORYSJ|nr:hypothetical protein EE612_053503 [Oryza sativa]BAT12697.1 Os11g0149400 [Oryza sativa Japonica Group]